MGRLSREIAYFTVLVCAACGMAGCGEAAHINGTGSSEPQLPTANIVRPTLPVPADGLGQRPTASPVEAQPQPIASSAPEQPSAEPTPAPAAGETIDAPTADAVQVFPTPAPITGEAHAVTPLPSSSGESQSATAAPGTEVHAAPDAGDLASVVKDQQGQTVTLEDNTVVTLGRLNEGTSLTYQMGADYEPDAVIVISTADGSLQAIAVLEG